MVGKFDYFDPNTDFDANGDSRNYFNFGLNYKPDENVTISQNVLIETNESIPNGRSIDALIKPRITFFYSFLKYFNLKLLFCQRIKELNFLLLSHFKCYEYF